MLSGRLLRLILLISCAHAMAHVYELSLPSVEMGIAADYQVGKPTTGLLSTIWRLPWGLGAFVSGWLVDRYGARRMLTIYLLGCSVCCLLAATPISLSVLFVLMFLMGSFASIYHPAGLALISHETSPENRTRALGLHGIFGSAGIGLAPFLAAGVLAAGFSWRSYYLLLAIPGTLLGLAFAWSARRQQVDHRPLNPHPEEDRAAWGDFFLLTFLALLQGFTYSGVLTFLPRFLSDLSWGDLSADSRGSLYTGGVLIIGCLGQYLAGRYARPSRLEWQLAMVTAANVPFLIWMAFADGMQRLVAAAGFALVHFMHQPIYNSLIAKYSPRNRRSICYGFSFAMGLGVGSSGAAFAGFSTLQAVTYSTFAVTSTTACAIAIWLHRRNQPGKEALADHR